MDANNYYRCRKRKMVDKSMKRKRSPRNAKNRSGRRVKKRSVEIGNEYEVDITEITPNGAGIAIIKGFLILVDDTKLGDHVKVKITKTYRMNAEAEIVT
jgi:predicted RNA-binding protein with TRAM domain